MSQKSSPQLSFESSSRSSISGPPKNIKNPPNNLVLALYEKNQSKVHKAIIKSYKKLDPLPIPEIINEDLSWYENIKTKVGTYSGTMTKAYTFHGFGALLKENGSIYEGNFRMHQPNGFGRLIDTDGTVYEGRWINDTIIGHGKITSSVFVYDGELENNTPHGRGTKISDEGKYIGEFKKGLKHGYGEFTYANECIYKGNFKNDKREGSGKLITSDGIFEGNWHKDKLNGEGTFKNTEFNYNGDFVNDARQGYGVMVWNDGRKYEGEWKSNMMHGDGAYVDENGNEFKGRWRKSQLKKSGPSSNKKKQYAEGVFGSESERSSEVARSPPSNAISSSVEEILEKVSKMTDEENFMSPKSEGVISRASYKPNMDIPKNKLVQAKELTDDSVSFNFEELKTSYLKEENINTKDGQEEELMRSQTDQESSEINDSKSNRNEESQIAFKIPQLENPLLAEDLSFRMKKQEDSSFLMSEKEENDPKKNDKIESESDWNFKVSEEENIVKRKHKKHSKSSSEEERKNPFAEIDGNEEKKKKKKKIRENIEGEELETSQGIDKVEIQDKQEFGVMEKEEEVFIEFGNQKLDLENSSEGEKIKTKKHRKKKKAIEESENNSDEIIVEVQKPLELSDIGINEKKKSKKHKKGEIEFTTPGEISASNQSEDELKISKKKKRRHKKPQIDEGKKIDEDLDSSQIDVEDSFALGKIRHKELEESDIIQAPSSESSIVSNQSSIISEAQNKSNKSSDSEEKSSIKSKNSSKSNKSNSDQSWDEKELSQKSSKLERGSSKEEQSQVSDRKSSEEIEETSSVNSSVKNSEEMKSEIILNASRTSSQNLEHEYIESDIEFGDVKVEESPSQSVSNKSSFHSQAPAPLNDSEVNISSDESSTKWVAPMHEPSLDETLEPVQDISLPDTPLPSNSTNLNNFMLPKSRSDMKISSLEENYLVQKDEESEFQTERSSVTVKSEVKSEVKSSVISEKIDDSLEKETDERIIKLKSVHFPHEERKDFELFLIVRNSLAPFIWQDPDFVYPKALPEFCEWKEIAPGIYYYGEWSSRNQRCGRGIEIFYNQVYEGFWKNNKRNGLGRVITKEGDIYEGYWVNNVKSGFGVLTKQNGQTYIGDWFLDTPNGLGYEDDKNEIYSGQVKYAMRHGRGFLQMRDGATYEGEFLEDKVHGRGILRREDGTVYDGHFVDGKIKGSGEEVPNYNLKVKIPRIKDLTTKDIALEIEKPRKSVKY